MGIIFLAAGIVLFAYFVQKAGLSQIADGLDAKLSESFSSFGADSKHGTHWQGSQEVSLLTRWDDQDSVGRSVAPSAVLADNLYRP